MVELIESILIYKLPQLGWEEIEAMFGLSELKQTKVYQEAKEEGREEGRVEGRVEGIEEEKKKIALNLLRRKTRLEEIAEITELSIEQVRQLQQKSS